MHNLESLESLHLTSCQVYGSLENARINTKARFVLRKITLLGSSTEFEILGLAKLLLQSESLKQQLSINFIFVFKGSEKIVLKDL